MVAANFSTDGIIPLNEVIPRRRILGPRHPEN
jgi:hypothetical protein